MCVWVGQGIETMVSHVWPIEDLQAQSYDIQSSGYGDPDNNGTLDFIMSVVD